ncbi:MAG TPA: TetR/AcrR family transcriptional regulator [Ktedonobacterales bacterium]|nr:TetR/AcrR family transcriptional regulator [Ktedonobacterales bacterium]
MSGATPRRLGRPPRAENQRERIMREAAILFGRSGYDTSSLNDLAAEVGISKAGLYHYFKTKQDVYDAIIIEALAGLFDHVSGAVERVAEPKDKLMAFMTAHAEFFERNYWAFRCMLVSFSGMSSPKPRQDAVILRERYERMLRAIIADGVRRGDFRDVDPASVGRAALSMLNWMARWFRPDGPKSAPEVAREYGDLLFHGLAR